MQSIQNTAGTISTFNSQFNLAAPDLGRLWLDQMKDTVGFRRGTSPSPMGEMTAVEVCSWVQVPALIQELRQNRNCIRLTFPKCSDSALSAEQSDIHLFLSKYHGLSLEEVRTQLVAKIEKSVYFCNSDIPRKEEFFPTSENWVNAFIPSSKGNRGVLSVTDVVIVDPVNIEASYSRINDQFISAPDTKLPNRQRILWLPSDSTQRNNIVEKGTFISELHSLLSTSSSTKVWVGKSSIQFSTTQAELEKELAVAQFGWDEYLGKFPPFTRKVQDNQKELLPGVPRDAIKSISKYSENIEGWVSWLAQIASSSELDTRNFKPPYNSFLNNIRVGGVPFVRPSGHHNSPHPGASFGASAQDILAYCRTRSMSENAEKLLQAFAKNDVNFWGRHPISQVTHRSDLVTLPAKGKAYFLTDLEGNVESVRRLLEKENILERWRANDPDDQVYLCILGDSVDRSDSGQLLINYLLELKYRENFQDKVWILAGNHEVEFQQQTKNRYGFCYELLARRKNELPVPRSDWDEWLQTVSALCPPSFKHPYFVEHCGGEDCVTIKGGMWALYFELFYRLPKMIRAENGAFAVHAGPPFEKIARLPTALSNGEQKELLGRTEFLADRGKPIEQPLDNRDMVWNDFHPEWEDKNDPDAVLSNSNEDRGVGRIYTSKAFENFAKEFGVSMMIRGHQSEVGVGGERLDGKKRSWRHGSVLTLVGEYAKLDLSIVQPKVSDVLVTSL